MKTMSILFVLFSLYVFWATYQNAKKDGMGLVFLKAAGYTLLFCVVLIGGCVGSVMGWIP